MENYPEKNEYHLTPEENKILAKAEDILAYKDVDKWTKKQNKIISFINKLKDKNIIHTDYILGCVMVGGTPEEHVTEFDTKDGDIAYFIINKLNK